MSAPCCGSRFGNLWHPRESNLENYLVSRRPLGIADEYTTCLAASPRSLRDPGGGKEAVCHRGRSRPNGRAQRGGGPWPAAFRGFLRVTGQNRDPSRAGSVSDGFGKRSVAYASGSFGWVRLLLASRCDRRPGSYNLVSELLEPRPPQSQLLFPRDVGGCFPHSSNALAAINTNGSALKRPRRTSCRIP
jgi:hypothetical protein